MKNSVSLIRNHHFQGLEATEIDQKSTENRHRVSDAFFVTFWSKSTLILTSKMEPFGHREPLKNVSKIWPRKKGVQSFSCAALPVAPLPPIMSEHTKKIDPKIAFRQHVQTNQKVWPVGRFSACLNTPKSTTRRSLFGTCSGKPAPKSERMCRWWA